MISSFYGAVILVVFVIAVLGTGLRMKAASELRSRLAVSFRSLVARWCIPDLARNSL
jgi:hypothetical protein